MDGSGAAAPPPAGTWRDMQERYLQKVLRQGDDPRFVNGMKRYDMRKFKRPARTPMEVAVSTAELTIAEREEAEEAKLTVDELRKQLREKQAEVTQLRKGTLDLRDKIQTLEFRVQEARSFSVQQEKTLHSLSLQIHRKDRQIRSLLKLEHGRLIRLVARFVLAVNGVNGRIDRLRGELLSRAEDEEPGAGETGSDASCEQA